MKNFVLAGNPNCGKTTLFNSLTGSTAHVGNWPGVTVDKKDGVYKKCPEPVTVIDLPGIYSLSPYTPEEVVSRRCILDEKPDCVINIVDATHLERNLYLTTQLMEIDVPVVVAFNMMDEVEKSGDKINVEMLSKRLNLPIVPISALKESGLTELMNAAYNASLSARQGETVLKGTVLEHLIGDCRIALEGQGVDNTLFHAVKLAELDEIEVAAHPSSAKMVEEFKTTVQSDDVFEGDFEAMVADARYKYIIGYLSEAVKRNYAKDDYRRMTPSDKADRVMTHKVAGIPIFLLILFAIFHLTFSTNFLGLGFGVLSGWVSLRGTAFEGVFGSGGLNSPGVILTNLVELGLDKLSSAVASGLNSAGASQWAVGLITDGVLGGLFAVIGFLPQILLLFLFFSILEDSGYMARVAFILDRIFRKFGLSGRAFMPMIMGFGCSVPAMINTRTLADERERTATIRVIPFFSCGAKLPILTAVSGGILTAYGVKGAGAITYGMYLLGIIVAVCSVLIMRSTTMRGDTPPFIMELPNYRLPQFKSTMLHLWDKAEHFIKKAFTVILASTIVIWFVSHFSWNWHYLSDENMDQSILAGIGQLIQPLFTPLGFGVQLGNMGWVFVVAALTGLIAKENVVATLGTLGACVLGGTLSVQSDGGAGAVAAMITATGVSVPALIAFVAFNMLTVPCVAAVATARAELPAKKRFGYTLLFWVVTSYLVATMIYVIGSWWWTCFIFAAGWAAACALIVLLAGRRQGAKKEAE